MELASGKTRFTISGPRKGFYYAAISPDESYLASSQVFSTVITLWSIETGKIALQLPGHKVWTIAAAFSPDSRLLASMDEKGEVLVWNLKTRKAIHKAKADPKDFTKLRWSAESGLVAVYGAGKPARSLGSCPGK